MNELIAVLTYGPLPVNGGASYTHTVLKIDAKHPRASSLPWRCDETTSSF